MLSETCGTSTWRTEASGSRCWTQHWEAPVFFFTESSANLYTGTGCVVRRDFRKSAATLASGMPCTTRGERTRPSYPRGCLMMTSADALRPPRLVEARPCMGGSTSKGSGEGPGHRNPGGAAFRERSGSRRRRPGPGAAGAGPGSTGDRSTDRGPGDPESSGSRGQGIQVQGWL